MLGVLDTMCVPIHLLMNIDLCVGDLIFFKLHCIVAAVIDIFVQH